jgi:hypothetical protein
LFNWPVFYKNFAVENIVKKMKKVLCIKYTAFTLIEAMIAVVILGFASAAAVLPFASGASLIREGSHRTLAANLGSDLTEQIINTPFDQILATYCDYMEGQGQMIKADGSLFIQPVYAKFSRKAICTNWPADNPQGNFILITVKIFYDGKELAQIQRLKGR